jgi:hypothetical protein
MTGVGGQILFNANGPGFTGLSFPVGNKTPVGSVNFGNSNSGSVRSVDFSNCDDYGRSSGGLIFYTPGSQLVNIKFPPFPQYQPGPTWVGMARTSVRGGNVDTIDMRGVKKTSGEFEYGFNAAGMALRTLILSGATGQGASNLDMSGCRLGGSLDFSGFTEVNGSGVFGWAFSRQNNSNTAPIIPITQFLFPSAPNRFTNCQMQMWSMRLATSLDFSGLTNAGGIFVFHSNPGLTGIKGPTNSANGFTQFHAYSCGLTGELDLSGFKTASGSLLTYSNTNLTRLKLPNTIATSTSLIITQLQTHLCNLQGTLDLSQQRLSGTLQCHQNPGLTSVLLGNNSAVASPISSFNSATCNLLGTFNASQTNFGGAFNIELNPGLTSILLGPNSGSVTTPWTLFSAYGCGLIGTLNIPGSWSGAANCTLTVYNNSGLTAINFTSYTPNANTKFDSINLSK